MKNINVKAIGLMSGSSLDGLDLCLVTFNKNNLLWQYKIVVAETLLYDELWKNKLINSAHLDSIALQLLDLEFGFFLGNAVNDFVAKNKIELNEIDFISSHGHTVFHQPNIGITYQIGNGAAILKKTNKTVICDFRKQDVVFGGQGAPLVPIGDKLLFSQYNACLNLGGFSNISFQKNNKTIAFDICPANTVLNNLTKKYFNKEFDEAGNIAKEGTIITDLLKDLNLLAYYRQTPPKSLGVEWVESQVKPLLDFYANKKDVLATFIEHIACQIANVLLANKLVNTLITGGGAKNKFLIERIEANTKFNISLPETALIDFKEALIFAFLGVLKFNNEVNVLSSVTGAFKDHSSGVIYLH